MIREFVKLGFTYGYSTFCFALRLITGIFYGPLKTLALVLTRPIVAR